MKTIERPYDRRLDSPPRAVGNVEGKFRMNNRTSSRNIDVESLVQRLENCFVGEGQWDPAKQRFVGAPDWRVVASALERTLHDLQ